MANQKGKKDFLTTCMNSMEVKGTVQEFRQAFCSVCVNPECTQSQWADSQWIRRMLEQEKVLNNPQFVDPSRNKELEKKASQDFISISNETASFYGGWVDVKEDGKVVHHAEPETENKSSDKIDQNVNSLKNEGDEPSQIESRDTEEAEDTENKEEAEAPVFFQEAASEPDEGNSESAEDANGSKSEVSNPTEDHKKEDEDPEVRDPAPKQQPQKKSRGKKMPKNTEAPKEGIMLQPSSPFEDRNSGENQQSALIHKEDPWAVKKPAKKSKDGTLKVRIDDGEVIEE